MVHPNPFLVNINPDEIDPTPSQIRQCAGKGEGFYDYRITRI